MKQILLTVIGVVALLYAAALLIPFEPEDRRPGTRLGGDLAADQDPDWSFLEPRTEIYVETRTWYGIPHSVTTVAWAGNGNLYVPCGRCAGKRWPANVERDPRVRLKINGKLYERSAVRITDETDRRRLLGTPAEKPLPDVDVFRMEPTAG